MLPWMLSMVTMTLTTMGTMAQEGGILESPPPPPFSTKSNPTWPELASSGQSTRPTETDKADDPFSTWPWWYWVAGGCGVFFLLLLNIIICVGCLCKRKRSRRANRNNQEANVEIRAPPTDFRRMESSAAKRYLHNIASVFSWGSDFDAQSTCSSRRPSSNVIYANSTTLQGSNAVYANTQTLGIHPPTSAADARKSGPHYHNVG